MATVAIFINGIWTAAEFAHFLDEVEIIAKLSEFSWFESVLPEEKDNNFHFEEERSWRLNLHAPQRSEYDDFARRILESKLRMDDLAVSKFISNQPLLTIKQIHLASPGRADFLGFGKIVEQVRIFITDIIDRVIQRDDREIGRDMQRQKLLEQKIKNAEKLLKLAEKTGLREEDKVALLRRTLDADAFIEGKVLQGKITYVSSEEESPKASPV